MTAPDAASRRWVYADGHAHVVRQHDALAFVTTCGLSVTTTVPTYPVPPSLDVCRSCQPAPGPLTAPPPTFPTPTTY